MTDRASVHTGNASEQFLLHNGTLILVHTVPEQKPIRYSVNIAFTLFDMGEGGMMAPLNVFDHCPKRLGGGS